VRNAKAFYYHECSHWFGGKGAEVEMVVLLNCTGDYGFFLATLRTIPTIHSSMELPILSRPKRHRPQRTRKLSTLAGISVTWRKEKSTRKIGRELLPNNKKASHGEYLEVSAPGDAPLDVAFVTFRLKTEGFYPSTPS
jgi:hypothetical protein